MQEDAQLRGIPFSEVIFDSTGKHVLACNPKDETNARVLKQMSSVLDEVMARLNAPESPIQGIPRINEVSSHFEDLIRELLNKTPGLACDFPKTAAGGKQRSGYPDLELVDQLSHRVYYLDPKLYAIGSRDSSFRTFYFEPKVATNKVREDAVHFIVGFEHEKPPADRQWKIHTLGLGRPFTFSGETESGISGEQSGYVSAGSDRRDEWEERGVMERWSNGAVE